VDQQPGAAPVTAIVAAYNEAERIGSVLEVLTSYPGFADVIVVDDGSTDGTGEVVAGFPVRYLRVEPNQGKGHAMDLGVQAASTPVVFFADADIHGLTHEVIGQVVGPVADGDVEMFIAMRNRKIYLLRLVMAFVPLLGGERALTKALWERVPARYKDRFRIEAALNFYALHFGKGLRFKVCRGISQTVKERKYGAREGIRRRLRMFRDIGVATWDLQFQDAPPTLRSRRAAARNVVFSVLGILLGVLVLLATYLGPASVVARLFSEELREDPTAPLVRTLLFLGGSVSVPILAAAGSLLVFANLTFFALSLMRLVRSGTERSES
jgi:glycosyltransferase involved in cell wall biosynthesis